MVPRNTSFFFNARENSYTPLRTAIPLRGHVNSPPIPSKISPKQECGFKMVLFNERANK